MPFDDHEQLITAANNWRTDEPGSPVILHRWHGAVGRCVGSWHVQNGLATDYLENKMSKDDKKNVTRKARHGSGKTAVGDIIARDRGQATISIGIPELIIRNGSAPSISDPELRTAFTTKIDKWWGLCVCGGDRRLACHLLAARCADNEWDEGPALMVNWTRIYLEALAASGPNASESLGTVMSRYVEPGQLGIEGFGTGTHYGKSDALARVFGLELFDARWQLGRRTDISIECEAGAIQANFDRWTAARLMEYFRMVPGAVDRGSSWTNGARSRS